MHYMTRCGHARRGNGFSQRTYGDEQEGFAAVEEQVRSERSERATTTQTIITREKGKA